MILIDDFNRLQLPGEIEENNSSSGSYDCEKGDFVFHFSKVNKGEHFENLDMITVLLAPPTKKSTVIPNIEVIGKLYEHDIKNILCTHIHIHTYTYIFIYNMTYIIYIVCSDVHFLT